MEPSQIYGKRSVGLSINRAPGTTTSNDDGLSMSQLGTSTLERPISRMTSDSEIELECLPVVPSGTQSTDDLLPPRDIESLPDVETVAAETEISKQQERVAVAPFPKEPHLPNYKPLPLRWPCLVLMGLLVAGLFAFLEYETHILPTPKYHAIELDPPKPSTPSHGTSTGLHARETKLVKDMQVPKTSSSAGPSTPIMTITSDPAQRTLAISTPYIKARTAVPPPEDWPNPDNKGDFCFWHAPKWELGIGFGGRFLYLQEYIEFLIVSDTGISDVPLCPCHSVEYTAHNESRIRIGSTDESCESVFNAIRTLNEMADRNRYTMAYDVRLAQGFGVYTTPPDISVPWIYPTTAANGDVMIPLEMRTTTSAVGDDPVSNVFGDRLDSPPLTGLFPAGHTGTEALYTWGVKAIRTPADGGPPVTDEGWVTITTVYPSRSLSWWKLPLSRPTSRTSSTNSIASIASSTSSTSSPSTTSTTSIPHFTFDSTTTSASDESAQLTSHVSTSESPSSAFESTPTLTTTKIGASVVSTEHSRLSTAVTLSTLSRVIEESFSGASSTLEDPGLLPLPAGPSTASQSITPNLLTEGTITKGSSITSAVKDAVFSTRQSPKPKGTSSSSSQTDTTTQPITQLEFTTESDPPPKSPLSIVLATWTTTDTVRTGLRTQTMTGLVSISTETIGIYSSELVTSTWTETIVSKPPGSSATPIIIGTQIHTETSAHFREFTETVTRSLYPTFPTVPAATWNTKQGPIPTNGPLEPGAKQFFGLTSEKDYLMASLIPVLLATLLAIPLQVLSKAVTGILPFRALNSPQGASPQDSVCLSRSPNLLMLPGISTRFLRTFRDPLPLMSLLLTILSLVIIPLSSETIMIEFMTDACTSLDWPLQPWGYSGPCARGLRKSVVPTRVAETMLVLMGLLLLGMGISLVRWRSGMANEPWSIASLAALFADSSGEVKGLILGTPGASLRSTGHETNSHDPDMSRRLERALEGKRFRLGSYNGHAHSTSTNDSLEQQTQRGPFGANEGRRKAQKQFSNLYGIYTITESKPVLKDDKGDLRLTVKDPPERAPISVKGTSGKGEEKGGRKWLVGTWISVFVLRTLVLVLTTGLLILILYYENTFLDTPFERFMDSQTIGVRFMFTAMGTGISLFWDYYFTYTSSQQIYQQLSRRSSPEPRNGPKSSESIHLITQSPPISELVTLWGYISYPIRHIIHRLLRRSDMSLPTRPPAFELAAISLGTFLAKFTPILLSGVPFRNTVTWKMHETYTWLLVGVLSYMVLVLFLIATVEVVPIGRAISFLLRSFVLLGELMKSLGNIIRLLTRKLEASLSFLMIKLRLKKSGVGTRKRSSRDGQASTASAAHQTWQPSNSGSEAGDISRIGRDKGSVAMPLDPNTIASCMYYICDSHMLRDFEGLATMSSRERDRLLRQGGGERDHGSEGAGPVQTHGGKEYLLGRMVGVSGVERIGVDYAQT